MALLTAWTVIRITTDQYAQLSALAQREGRTAPAQLRALLSESFKQAGEVEEGAGLGRRSATVEEDGGIGRSADNNPVPSSTSSRKAKCEHRIPPGSYCRVCDQ